jgi:nicotinate-nucleotide adenylyltransferase
MTKTAKRIGIFGGAFDPPHFGHLISAQYAAELLVLDKVIFVPSGKHPYKEGSIVASEEQRFAMTKLAVAGNPLFEVSASEIVKQGVAYTFETLEHVRREYGGATFFLLIGADNVAEFGSWENAEGILELATVAVLDRKFSSANVGSSPITKDFIALDTPTIEISSSEIRSRIKEGKSVRYLIRNGVELFIDMTGLYR